MKTIWKYELPIGDYSEVAMQQSAQILSAAVQKESICVWAVVDTEVDTEMRRFRIVGTGHEIVEWTPPDDGIYRRSELDFIDTVMMYGGSLVFHVFEVIQ